MASANSGTINMTVTGTTTVAITTNPVAFADCAGAQRYDPTNITRPSGEVERPRSFRAALF
jgi:hypothetical protein